jgi:hypothetical protein
MPSEMWRPTFSDIIAIGALVATAVMWLTQPNWQIGIPVSALIVGLVIFAASRHQSHPVRRGLAAASVIGIYIWVAWQPISKSIQTDFPRIAFQWPVKIDPQESPPSPDVPQEPLLPTQSRLDRFIFACDIQPPRNPEEGKKQKETLQANIQAWADTIGVSASFSDIPNGTRVTAEAKTKEAKARFASMGLLPTITKVFLETRWVIQRQIVVAHAELPKDASMLSTLAPDPSAPEIIRAQDLIAQFLGAPEGACHLI